MNDTDRFEEFFATNRWNWDERVGVHLTDKSGIYRIDSFRRGEDSLGPIEGTEIGDVSGKRLLHLQCHFGLDSISLERRGADVAALDFSNAAVSAARKLATEVGSNVVEANVYDAPAAVGDGFDFVFSSWGGIVYLAEGHPTLFSSKSATAASRSPITARRLPPSQSSRFTRTHTREMAERL
jgi:hypothetical protein